MKILIYILSIAFTIYAVLSLFVFFFGEKLAYPAPDASYKEGDIKELFFIEDIACLYLDRGAEYTILFSHGNGEDLGMIYSRLQNFAALGYNVLAYDYSGYGLSKGTPSEANVYKNADRVFDYLVNTKNVASDKVIIVGFSMGSSASNYLASKENVVGLILIGGFASAMDCVSKYKIFPFNFLKNIDKIDKVLCSVLFIHGTKDRIVPYSNVEKMYAKCKAQKTLLTIEGAGHNDVFSFDEPKFWSEIKEFKKKL